MSMPHVLVVEDDPAIRRGLVDALTFAGYRVDERSEGPAGLDAALSLDVDLVLLDVLLPGMDGIEILGVVRRAKPRLPVIMVTARGAEDDRVEGLKGGADDYVVKPFSARELLARVEAVLRRSAERPHALTSVRVAGRTIDLERREVTHADGSTAALSEREAAVLHYLASSPGRVVSRDELLQRVWGIDPRGVSTRTVDMHVVKLRQKLADDPGDPKLIVTVRSRGYLFPGESPA